MGETAITVPITKSSWLEACSQLAIIVVALISVVVLLGWIFNIGFLKSVIPGWTSMKVNTTLALAASAMALWAGQSVSESNSRRIIRQVLASFVVLVGTLTLAEYAFQVNLGIDQILFQDLPASTMNGDPGRMSPATALCSLFCGVSLFVMGTHHRASQRVAYLTLLITLAALVGYAFSVGSLYTVGVYTAMAIHTAIAFMLLAMGILAAQPKNGFVRVLISDTAGGIVSRTLLATTPFAVFSIGALLIYGEDRNYYDSRFTLALMVTLCISTLTFVIAEVSTRLHGADLSREQASVELASFNIDLERRVADRTKELELVNSSLIAEVCERQRVEEDVRKLSLTDDLTGLHNRRSFFLLASQHLRAARRTHTTSLLFFADVDGLKQTNDTYGHAAGDLLIAATAQVLKECFRNTDIVARIGGDEFVILAVDSGESPEVISDRMQALINEFNRSGRFRYLLSLSTGVVSCHPSELKSLGELLASADAMMYANKKQRQLA